MLFKIKLILRLRKRVDQALISKSTILKFSAPTKWQFGKTGLVLDIFTICFRSMFYGLSAVSSLHSFFQTFQHLFIRLLSTRETFSFTEWCKVLWRKALEKYLVELLNF